MFTQSKILKSCRNERKRNTHSTGLGATRISVIFIQEGFLFVQEEEERYAPRHIIIIIFGQCLSAAIYKRRDLHV